MGESLGSFTAGAATAVVGSALSIAGAAIPDGERLAAAGKNVFSNTAGRAFGYAGAVAGRFAGTYAGLLEQSYNAKQQSGGGINIKAAFQMVTGGATAREALSRSMIFAGSHAVHPQAGQMVLEGMQGERRARLETAHTAGAAAGGPTSSLDGVRYSGDV